MQIVYVYYPYPMEGEGGGFGYGFGGPRGKRRTDKGACKLRGFQSHVQSCRERHDVLECGSGRTARSTAAR